MGSQDSKRLLLAVQLGDLWERILFLLLVGSLILLKGQWSVKVKK